METRSADSTHRFNSETQLDEFIDKYSPELAVLIRASLTKMRAGLPPCVEFMYDNHYALVIGFGPSERPSEALFSVAAYPNHVSLCFLHGASLHDQHGILKGSGKRVRHIVLNGPDTLDRPEVRNLIAQSLAMSPQPFAAQGRKTLIKAVATNPRPRRPVGR